MDNAVESILIAFAVIVFVIALSMTTYLLSTAMSTTETLIYNSDKTNYLDNIEVEIVDSYTRTVGIDTVINSLYRYYKENFMVKIYDNNGTPGIKGPLHQIFDTTIEGKLFVAASKPYGNRNPEEHALMRMYSDDTHYSGDRVNMFGAPWMGNTNIFAKQRVDLYVSGQKGHINNKEVNYNNPLVGYKKFMELSSTNTFKEIFVEYMYSGDTYSTEDGIESITGSEKPKNKIIIEYIAQ